MKRKALKFFLSLMAIAFALQSAAQDVPWFESNHEWFYKSWCSGAGSPGPCGYRHFTVEAEETIGGFEASVLLASIYDEAGTVTMSTTHYFRTSGDSVFHYYEPSEIWYLLYSFNTPVGETWVVQDDVFVGYGLEDDLVNWRFEVMVDSITTEEIGGISRRRVHTRQPFGGNGFDNSMFSFTEGIVEGIGAVGMSMFGDPIAFIGLPGAFSCFIEHEEIVYGPFGYPCNILSTTENEPGTLEIFPNPAVDRFSIILPENSQPFFELRIYDLAGRLAHSGLQYQADQSIALPDFSSGLYILQVRNADGIFSGKLMVE